LDYRICGADHRHGAGAVNVSFCVNGESHELDVAPNTLLVSVLREHLGLTGTHVGCDTSQCGACTIHLNGRAVKSCAMLAVQAQDAEVVTIEGLGSVDDLHPMQQAFRDCHGLQCGFCTPGMIMQAVDLATQVETLDADAIRQGMEGNLCRCTGYQNIVAAVAKGAVALKAQSGEV
jgi:carbon-monoxide dehydrogenase small subunit